VIVLVHSGVCDASMWDGFDVPGARRHEMRGFGHTPAPADGTYWHGDDLIATLGDEPGTLVGASFGGLVCMDVASRRPELVGELVLLDAPLPDHDWSDEMEQVFEREDEMVARGELREAAELMADVWLEDASLRDRVIEMQGRAYRLQLGSKAELDFPETIDLGAITARTLVVVGDLDKPDLLTIAERLEREIPDARHAVIEGSGHLPALERPDETARLVRDFLGV
jgi:pimeloyl-ACP methyl ester carboxylesterase